MCKTIFIKGFFFILYSYCQHSAFFTVIGPAVCNLIGPITNIKRAQVFIYVVAVLRKLDDKITSYRLFKYFYWFICQAMTGFCAVHCIEQPVSLQFEQLTIYTKLETLKHKIYFFLLLTMWVHSENSDRASLLSVGLWGRMSCSATAYCYIAMLYKFLHRRYLIVRSTPCL